MFHYTILQWLLFFYIYCFMGWCWETAYVSVKKRQFVNRGFMGGPFLPIYGTGAIMMLLVSAPFQDNLVLTYFAGVAGATVLELFTGGAMEMLFKVRYWDYSNQPFNYKGYICLSSSVAWGFFTIFLTKVMHKPIEYFVLELPKGISDWASILLTCYIVVDFGLSFKGAINLRNMLDKMERAREELAIMERRLDAMIAFSIGGRQEEKRDSNWYKKLRLDELKNSVNQRFESMKQSIQGGAENAHSEIEVQRGKFQDLMENHSSMVASKKKSQGKRIFRNPTMVSKRYQNSLNELKQIVLESRKKK